MRTVALMQPYLFPYVGYFSLIHSCDVFGFRDDCQWIKGGWINRNKVWNQCREDWLTIPVEKIHSTDRIFEVKVADPNFKKNLLNKAKDVFWDAPNKDLVLDLINDLPDSEYVAEIVEDSISRICYTYLGMDKTILSCVNMASLEPTSEGRLIDMVKQMKGTRYVNMVGGKSLYDKSSFYNHELKLEFLTPNTPSYRRDNSDNPVPGHLSILDMLAYLDLDEVLRRVADYDLT